MKIFCIIPALNEEKTIKDVIEKVKPLVDRVVVVDDGSTDATCNLARESGAVVLTHLINRGQGASLETGNQYALRNGADMVVHFDADGQFLAEEIGDLVGPILERRAEVSLGSRFMGKKSNMPFFKKIILIPIAHLVNKFILKLSLTDPQSGFRAMSRRALEIIKIEQNGMAHCSEILYKISKYNLSVIEIPTTVIYHNFGQKFSGGVRIVKDLILAKLMD